MISSPDKAAKGHDIDYDTKLNLFGKEMTLKMGMLRPSPLSPSLEFPTFIILGSCSTMSLLLSRSLAVAPLAMNTKKMVLNIFAIIRLEGEICFKIDYFVGVDCVYPASGNGIKQVTLGGLYNLSPLLSG